MRGKYFWGIIASLSLNLNSARAADQPIFVYLIDPSDQTTIDAFAADPKEDTPTPPKKSKSLDDRLDELSKKPPLTKAQQRILTQVTAEQMEFLHSLDLFVKAPFDPKDDEATPEFNQIREKIVELVFKGSTERAFYERLFLINKSWLEHPKEIMRYDSLDKALRNRSLEIEERTRRFRQIITGVSAVGGAAVGGFLSFKVSQKVLPIVANEKGYATIMRWAGRSTIIFVGAGVGAAAGAYLGFLGSEYVFQKKDYIDPIDGDEDLRDILDVIQTLP